MSGTTSCRAQFLCNSGFSDFVIFVSFVARLFVSLVVQVCARLHNVAHSLLGRRGRVSRERMSF
jgi:hypothetical protein